MSDTASSLRVPADLLTEIKVLAEQIPRANVAVPWSQVAIEALRRGARSIRAELEQAPPPEAAA